MAQPLRGGGKVILDIVKSKILCFKCGIKVALIPARRRAKKKVEGVDYSGAKQESLL